MLTYGYGLTKKPPQQQQQKQIDIKKKHVTIKIRKKNHLPQKRRKIKKKINLLFIN